MDRAMDSVAIRLHSRPMIQGQSAQGGGAVKAAAHHGQMQRPISRIAGALALLCTATYFLTLLCSAPKKKSHIRLRGITRAPRPKRIFHVEQLPRHQSV
jgi:hypothetical protein